ncbi:dipeptidyl aminopeptidase/acylaminoacyl peptidase [Parabacteroides sp. PF5-5]|uniref:S9 family peptidase n=1 Tax=unclassified Parabacteroides TaxID=2649774 RepID=UPI0024770CD6|nr:MULTISPECIES: prolyl oligopeptidase family serine peptidase [unclassified Parabacteroides]MDH6305811.1 dipeptidyl aminopeptidase/acylaminoacyl peptidase [Parabacteroides sp. PH5-39]MDH6317752.1 dipeptidyl aminopeptidase/acylaminoacyl peptidase [Parabacteroides sp. PF5-13]MDH6320583.1 dipeptidyl aminopeptidase/acylaminoacyl peptidase [Parabacteroides sp. PH5-13]MDH6324254.1 dipeptidyl aminopeptidase/acylaminoacyl peptidase [Parabacteroides sp. PH5-8]MDH6328937.1 dipeptidyl aminopeptidase/acy
MKKTNWMIALLFSVGMLYAADDVKIMKYQYAGPYEVRKPVMADSLNVNGKAFELKNLLKSSLSFEQALKSATLLDADTAGSVTFSALEGKNALHVLSFNLNTDRYVKGTLEVSGPGSFEVFVDNKSVPNTSELSMEPRPYQVVVKYLSTEKDTCPPSLKAVFKAKKETNVTTSVDADRFYGLLDIIEGKTFRSVSVSPNGKYVLVRYTNRLADGTSDFFTQLMDAATGTILVQDKGFINSAYWMPASSRLYYTRTGSKGIELVAVNPATMQEEILSSNLPKGNFNFTPDESSLLFTVDEEGPKESADITRILEPQDRLPGFRNRSFIWRYDLSTGLFEQLTFGHHATYINDVSADSRYMLFSTSERVYTSRPFSRSSLYMLDLHTMAVDTLWESASFVSRAVFSKDGKQLLVNGSADAFGGIGLNIKEGQISNTYDAQLFLYDIATKKVTALTKDFDPSISAAVWNKYDGQIYFSATDQDYQRVFVCNPSNGKISQLGTKEDVISSFSLAQTAPVMYYYGQSVSNTNRLYAYDVKTNRNRLIYDLSAERLENVVFGDVSDWNFTSEDGTTIQGRYYLPPNFDVTKKYSMIVYYYGGTTPTDRSLEHRYSMHMYAALGYVVYTLNPSGTIGYGQEFSARHVNAWGIKTADEIIKGTELFCREHPFVDEKKVGCIGASYGGFMTQYLQTRTDIFAAAVSHAGISALSSYWGYGYWGYGYCSVANADSYPWNNWELFVEQSPLFHADKINTPLLLLHGGVDTNVPIGESIQMFNALKLLGKTVEFIRVEGENHGIAAYKKRIAWQNSIFAWFAKWLRDEPEWWDAQYPERTL